MTALVVVLVLVLLAGIGVLVMRRFQADRRAQQDRTAQLNEAWRVMQAVNRINMAYWRARQLMQAEYERHQDEDSYSS